jgi:hypothetical protein
MPNDRLIASADWRIDAKDARIDARKTVRGLSASTEVNGVCSLGSGLLMDDAASVDISVGNPPKGLFPELLPVDDHSSVPDALIATTWSAVSTENLRLYWSKQSLQSATYIAESLLTMNSCAAQPSVAFVT